MKSNWLEIVEKDAAEIVSSQLPFMVSKKLNVFFQSFVASALFCAVVWQR